MALLPGTDARAQVLSMAGAWAGTSRTWFEPGVLADESPIAARIRVLPDCPIALYEYETAVQGRPSHGVALMAFNRFTGGFDVAWADSFHMSTNLMVSRSETAGGRIDVLGSYADPGGGPPWGWRTTFDLDGTGTLIVTAYNITPDGQEARAVEARLTRTGPSA